MFGMVGAIATAAVLVTGRIVGILSLLPSCLDVLRHVGASETEPTAVQIAPVE